MIAVVRAFVEGAAPSFQIAHYATRSDSWEYANLNKNQTLTTVPPPSYIVIAIIHCLANDARKIREHDQSYYP